MMKAAAQTFSEPVAAERGWVAVYADLFKARFALDAGGPTKPQELSQVARIYEGAGLLKDCVPYYRKALKIWEKDPAWQETSDALRKKLTDLAEKLGADFPKE